MIAETAQFTLHCAQPFSPALYLVFSSRLAHLVPLKIRTQPPAGREREKSSPASTFSRSSLAMSRHVPLLHLYSSSSVSSLISILSLFPCPPLQQQSLVGLGYGDAGSRRLEHVAEQDADFLWKVDYIGI